MRNRISGRIRKILKGERHKVSFRNGIVKFTDAELMDHLSKQFQPGMTWRNYGDVWHIDHKIPVRAFNLECAHDIKRCWSLENLQPLFIEDNLRKGGNLEKPFQPALV
jgi:hypothetical protein